MIRTLCALAAGGLLIAPPVLADDFSSALQGFCDKTKQCAIEGMGQSNLPPDQHAQIMAALNSMCIGIEQSYTGVHAYPDLASAAASCMRSKTALSCEELGGPKGDTKECQDYDALADQYRSGE